MPELPFLTWGDPASGTRALLIHGLGSNAATWWRTAEDLALAGWHVTAVDLRGHGTAPDASSYSLADYASDLPSAATPAAPPSTAPPSTTSPADAATTPSASWDLVIGHSLGGAAAILAASRAGFTRRLVLLDPVLEVRPEDAGALIADQLSEVGLTIDALSAAKPHWHPRDVSAKIAGGGRLTQDLVERSFADNHDWNVIAEASALGVPTLILGGDHDVYSMLPTETAETVVAANPLVSYRVVAGAGHSPHRDAPELTAAMLADWLGE